MSAQNGPKDPQNELLDKIDNYNQTIHALIGFMHFFRYDDKNEAFKKDVIIFQGWRLINSDEKRFNSDGEEIKFVTPDLGIVYGTNEGVLAEAKITFPMNRDFWMRPFEQLMSYDDDLKGWPTESGKINNHDVVLLLHQTRAVKVRIFYESKAGKEIIFGRPFIIIQFNRSGQRRQYYFFQKQYGALSEKSIDERLTIGDQIPMDIFVTYYSMIKLYDGEPPIPYMIHLIWENVVTPVASEDPKFEKLRKKQKMEIILEINRIIDDLQDGFTFHTLHTYNLGRKPQIPQRAWVISACDCMVNFNEAEWMDQGKKAIKIYFQKYDDVLAHFVSCCAEEEREKQMELFKTD